MRENALFRQCLQHPPFERLVQLAQMRFGSFAGGDIKGGSDNAYALAVSVKDRATLCSYPTGDAIFFTDRAVLDVIQCTSLGIERCRKGTAGELAILRMQIGVKVFHRDIDVGRDSEHRFDTWG